MKTHLSFQSNKIYFFGLLLLLTIKSFGIADKDTFAIYMLGHASLYFEYNDQIIHIDPSSSQANYSNLPDADLIYITHGHGDHYDSGAFSKIQQDSTLMVCTQAVKNLGTYTGPTLVMKNGDSTVVKGIPTKAVASYNLTAPNHPKGTGNGYILTFGEKRVYIAGDTENIPEMKSLGKIDIAFLPMNLPYTMSVPMAAEAAKIIKPDILYIYHFSNSDTAQLRKLLINEKMEIRMGKSTFFESDKQNSPVSAFTLNTADPAVQIYPNPSSGPITFDNLHPGSSLYIFDQMGKLVFKQEKIATTELIIELPLLKSGIFCAKIIHNQKEENKTFIIK